MGKHISYRSKDFITILLARLILLIVPAILIAMLLIVIYFGEGLLLSLCWNAVIPRLFSLGRLSLFNAALLLFTFKHLCSNLFNSSTYYYKKLKKFFQKMTQEESVLHTAKESHLAIFAAITTAVLDLVHILITTLSFMYSWNNIIPTLFNLEIAKINFIQSFCFYVVINFFLSHFSADSSYNKKESSKKESNNEELQNDDQIEELQNDNPIEELQNDDQIIVDD